MSKTPSLDDTIKLMLDLRKRCEWDAAQTHESLRPYLIEEAHELDDAIREQDDSSMREELGDVLLQVLFHSVVAEERGAFTIYDVAEELISKMKERHPHLYGDGKKVSWEALKSKKRKSIAIGLPSGLPSLHRAQRLQDRAAGVGFDWDSWDGPAQKVVEELYEVRELLESSPPKLTATGAPVMDASFERVEEELGDLLFACVNLCRKAKVHPSLALDRANAKFQRRFEAIERIAALRGINLSDSTLAQLDSIWDEVKAQEKAKGQ